ncbi:hypothetical protein Tco_0224147 [Tanacetum coccineum]
MRILHLRNLSCLFAEYHVFVHSLNLRQLTPSDALRDLSSGATSKVDWNPAGNMYKKEALLLVGLGWSGGDTGGDVEGGVGVWDGDRDYNRSIGESIDIVMSECSLSLIRDIKLWRLKMVRYTNELVYIRHWGYGQGLRGGYGVSVGVEYSIECLGELYWWSEVEVDIESRSLGLAACASLESKNEVCLLCEVNPKQIPAFDFICASLESILAIEDTWEREEVWGDIQVVPGFVGRERRLFGE